MIRLAVAYLADRPLTSALNMLLLGISVAMLVLLLQFSTQAQQRFERDIAGIDLVVGAKGSPLQLILSAVFHVDQPTGNIPANSLDLLRRDRAVSQAVPLALGDNFNGFRIVGTDSSFAQLYGVTLAEGREFGAPMETVLGAEVARQTGARLGQKFVGSHGLADDPEGDQGHDHAPFETVGILAPSGTVADRLILTSVESVWMVHGIEDDHDEDHGHEHGNDHDHADHDHDHDHDNHDQGEPVGAAPLQAGRGGPEAELTALLVTYRNASAAIRLPAMINRQTALQAAVPATETARLLELIGASLAGVQVFAWLLAATGGLAIFVALLSALRAREGDLALLRVMGASKAQVFGTVMLEGVITAAAGALLGWAAAHGLIALARARFATLADLGLVPFQFHSGEIALVAAVLAIGAFAALIPAIRIYQLDPARVLARNP
jgi:putative ABC transport system permease protein